jgi:hypothetical protein
MNHRSEDGIFDLVALYLGAGGFWICGFVLLLLSMLKCEVVVGGG